MRRHDSLLRTLITLLVALGCGLVFEADALRIWAERLPVGILRDAMLPTTTTWQAWMAPLRAGNVRNAALQMKSRLAETTPDKAMSGVRVPERRADRSGSAAQATGESPLAGTGVTRLVVSSVQDAVVVSPATGTDAAWSQAAGGGHLVALAGDSMMAVGLAPTLGRDFADNPNFRLLKAYRSGTGLARPEVFDWMQQYPAMLAGEQPQMVICSMGANDAQNVQIGKKVLEFGSEEWDGYYRGRLSSYLAMLGGRQVRVLWVGMPLMKERKFSLRMQHMNQVIQAEIAGRPNVTWLDPNPSLGYAKGFEQYRANARGKLIKLRADDGIHMTDDGAAYLLPAIREWMESVAPVQAEGTAVGRAGGIAPQQASGSAPKA